MTTRARTLVVSWRAPTGEPARQVARAKLSAANRATIELRAQISAQATPMRDGYHNKPGRHIVGAASQNHSDVKLRNSKCIRARHLAARSPATVTLKQGWGHAFDLNRFWGVVCATRGDPEAARPLNGWRLAPWPMRPRRASRSLFARAKSTSFAPALSWSRAARAHRPEPFWYPISAPKIMGRLVGARLRSGSCQLDTPSLAWQGAGGDVVDREKRGRPNGARCRRSRSESNARRAPAFAWRTGASAPRAARWRGPGRRSIGEQRPGRAAYRARLLQASNIDPASTGACKCGAARRPPDGRSQKAAAGRGHLCCLRPGARPIRAACVCVCIGRNGARKQPDTGAKRAKWCHATCWPPAHGCCRADRWFSQARAARISLGLGAPAVAGQTGLGAPVGQSASKAPRSPTWSLRQNH